MPHFHDFHRYPFTTTPPSLAPKLFTTVLHSPVLACFATTNPRPSLLRQSFCVLPTKPLNFALHLLHSHITLFFCTCFDTIHSCSAPHLLRCRAALPIFSHGVYSAPTSYAHLFCLSTPMSHFLPIFPRARPFFLVSFSQLTGHDLRLSFVRGAFCSLLRTCCAAVRSPVFFVYFYNSASLLSLPFSEILFLFLLTLHPTLLKNCAGNPAKTKKIGQTHPQENKNKIHFKTISENTELSSNPKTHVNKTQAHKMHE